MRTLFIDLASHSMQPDAGACIACVTEEETVAIRFIDHRIDDASLMPELDSVLQEAGWGPNVMVSPPNHDDRTIDRIACVTGPGGFTSLRMAATFANVLSDQLNIPLAGVHASEVYAARRSRESKVVSGETQNSKLKTQNSSFFWLHSTRSTHLFVRGFGKFAAQWPEPVLLSIDECSRQVSLLSRKFAAADMAGGAWGEPPTASGYGRPGSEGMLWAGELLPVHQEAMKNVHLVDAPLRSIAEALPELCAELTYGRTVVEPWYGRGW